MNATYRFQFGLILLLMAGASAISFYSEAGTANDATHEPSLIPDATTEEGDSRLSLVRLFAHGQKGLDSLTITETWFFGSSTTDSGAFQAAVPIIPDPPYFQGRFSNGPVWAEYFADILGTDATASAHGGTNYAFGAARTNVVSFGFIPPITTQVAEYLADVDLAADPQALYVLKTAANDLTAAKLQPPETAKEIMQSTVASTKEMIADLYEAGARNFMLLTIPELPTASTSAVLPDDTNLAELINDGLLQIAEEYEKKGASVWLLDLHSLIRDVVEDPKAFGLETVHCSYMGKNSLDILSGDLTPEPCEPLVSVDSYMMFDNQHYTTAMHDIVAQEAVNQLCAGHILEDAAPRRPCIVVH